jgi:hypothetical protein
MIDSQQRVLRRLILGISTLSIGACIVVSALVLLRPPRFSNFIDAIGYDLRQRGVQYRQVMINHAWPDTVNYQRYGAQLLVELDDHSAVHGRLECREEKKQCYFSLTELQINRQPLPELEPETPWPWLEWWDRATAGWK